MTPSILLSLYTVYQSLTLTMTEIRNVIPCQSPSALALSLFLFPSPWDTEPITLEWKPDPSRHNEGDRFYINCNLPIVMPPFFANSLGYHMWLHYSHTNHIPFTIAPLVLIHLQTYDNVSLPMNCC